MKYSNLFGFLFGLINPLRIVDRFTFYGGSGGGGGGNTTSTVTNYSMPDWLRPQMEAMLGGATQEYFQTSGNRITGMKPYTPYSANPEDYVAPFSPLQQQVHSEAANMGTPGQFAGATDLANVAGAGALTTVNPAMDYGNLGAQFGDVGAQFGNQGAQFGAQGAQFGAQGAQDAQQAYGVGATGMGYGALGAQVGMGYGQQATDPNAVGQFMSPYMQNVVDNQKQSAIRDAQVSNLTNNLAASRQGTYGGARNLLSQSEATRNLQSQLSDIQASGTQKAYEDAVRNQQFAANAAMQGAGMGIQGAQTGLQGIQTGLEGSKLGMQGAGMGIQGAQAGMQGAGLGIQGAQTGLQGVQGAQAGWNLAGQQASNLADIGAQQQQSDLARMQAQSGLGNQQQQRQQDIINQAVQNFGAGQDNAQRLLDAYSSLLHGYASPTTTTSAYTPAASAGSQMAGLGMSGLALAGMMGMAKGGKVKHRPQGIDTLAIRKASRSRK